MSQYIFGSGLMIATRIDAAGARTPITFGALQEVSLDFNASLKELFGSHQSPIAVARGTMKINGKAKMGAFQGSVMKELFFNTTSTAGQVKIVNNEPGTVPASVSYTITVANGADFFKDLGVFYADTGEPLQLVAAGPTEGEYAVSVSGVYTFAAADASAAVRISYGWTDDSAGQIITLSNQLLGTQPVFSLVLSNEYNGRQMNIQMNRCIASKFTFQNKLEDFNLPDFEFGCFADEANNIGTMWMSDMS